MGKITKEEFAKLIDVTGYVGILTNKNNDIIMIDYQKSLDEVYERASNDYIKIPHDVFYVIPGARFMFPSKMKG